MRGLQKSWGRSGAWKLVGVILALTALVVALLQNGRGDRWHLLHAASQTPDSQDLQGQTSPECTPALPPLPLSFEVYGLADAHSPAHTSANTPASSLTLQLSRLFADLQRDLTLYAFNAPVLELTVLARADLQAQALSPARIALSQGLMDAQLPDDELYAVLAHEAYHILNGDTDTVACGPDGRLSSVLSHGRELLADKGALELLLKSGRDSRALHKFLGRLPSSEGGTPALTHPSVAQRQARMDEVLANRSPGHRLPGGPAGQSLRF